MKQKLLIIMVMLLSIVWLSGCWDRKELQDVDIFSAIGIISRFDPILRMYSPFIGNHC
jgi:spore germination protein KC